MQLTQNHINQILQNLKLGQIEKGLQLTNNLLKTNPSNLQLNKLAAYIYSMKEEHHLSIEILSEIKIKFPNDFDIFNNLGHAYLNVEKLILALENTNGAIKIDPNHPAPYRNLAEIYLLLRDFDKAEEAINLCLEKTKTLHNSSDQPSNIIIIKTQILLAKNKKKSARDFLIKNINQFFDPILLLELINIDRDSIKNIIDCISDQQLMIYPTTNSGYGATTGEIHCDEKTPLNPISLYGTLKKEAEGFFLKRKIK